MKMYELIFEFKNKPQNLGFHPVKVLVRKALWKDLDKWAISLESQKELTDFDFINVIKDKGKLVIRAGYSLKISHEEIMQDWTKHYVSWFYHKPDREEFHMISEKLKRNTKFDIRRKINEALQNFDEKVALMSRSVVFAQGGIHAKIILSKDGEVLKELDNINFLRIYFPELKEVE